MTKNDHAIAKFIKGNKVRYIGDGGFPRGKLDNGQICEVIEGTQDYSIIKDPDGVKYLIYNIDLERYFEKPTTETQFEIRIYAPYCEPWNTFNQWVAKHITGNQLRGLLRRKILGSGVLNVSVFSPYCKSFKRDFIDPCLDKYGYPQNGVFTTHSKSLNMDVTYNVVVANSSYTIKLANQQFYPREFMCYGQGDDKEIVTKMIDYL